MALKTNTTITRMMDSPDYPVTVHAKQNDRRTRFVTLQCFDTENDFSITSYNMRLIILEFVRSCNTANGKILANATDISKYINTTNSAIIDFL